MFNKRQIAAAGLVLVTGLGGFASLSAADAAAPAAKKTTVGSITATPSSNLKNLQKVNVTVSGFGSFTGTAHIIQCTASVIQDAAHSDKYCDRKHKAPIKLSHGKGKGSFKVLVSTFKAGDRTQKCKKGGTCLILATTPAHDYAAFSQIRFAR